MINLDTYDIEIKCTIRESIDGYIYELERDAVGLWQIMPGGNPCQYSEEELGEFVRLHIRGLLEAGADPINGG